MPKSTYASAYGQKQVPAVENHQKGADKLSSVSMHTRSRIAVVLCESQNQATTIFAASQARHHVF